MSQLADPVAGRGLRSPDPMLPRLFRLAGRRDDTADTFTIWLDPADGHTTAFVPGQFMMLGVPGVGEVPISISGYGPGHLQHTVRDVGGVTHTLARKHVGDLVTARGPFGTGWSVATARGRDVVVIAGGIGLAPLRPAVLELIATREHFGRVCVLYGARTPQDLLFTDELTSWAAHDIEVLSTVDRGTADYEGRVGLVTALLDQAHFSPEAAVALVCGPEVMMRHTAAALLQRGVAADLIRVSLERNMRCGVGLCGHCQLRELFICLDGAVLDYPRVAGLLGIREL